MFSFGLGFDGLAVLATVVRVCGTPTLADCGLKHVNN